MLKAILIITTIFNRQNKIDCQNNLNRAIKNRKNPKKPS